MLTTNGDGSEGGLPVIGSHFTERWRATVPGHGDHRVLSDAASNSVYVSDGWGPSYAALRLHRLNLETGEHTAGVRTRQQQVSGMCLWQETLLVATDSRLFRLSRDDLGILKEWNSRLVRYTQHLVATRDLIIMANWLTPSVGVFDPHTGRTHRVVIGRQPVVFAYGDGVHVIGGFDGGMWTLDAAAKRVHSYEPTPPIFTAAAGREIWAVRAGPPKGGQGDPPVWTRRGADTLFTLSGPHRHVQLGGPCERIVVDDARDIVWCSVNGGAQLDVVSQVSGQVMACIRPLHRSAGTCSAMSTRPADWHSRSSRTRQWARALRR